MTIHGLALKSLTQKLTEKSLMPKNIEVSQSKNFYWVNAFDKLDGLIVSQNVNTGMDQSLTIATLKALTERIERKAFQDGFKNNLASCQTERSDGFAAMPIDYSEHKLTARQNALNEAIERYAWANWWDNERIAFEIESFSTYEFAMKLGDIRNLFEEVISTVKVNKIYEIRPKFNLDGEKSVTILIAELENGGVVSGGSCEDGLHRSSYTRALSELIRHLFALNKIKKENLSPTTFYENRLCYFATQDGGLLFKKRISAKGEQILQLPSLAIDEEIPHSLSDLVYVHRCLFENQPPFVDGALERLCL